MHSLGHPELINSESHHPLHNLGPILVNDFNNDPYGLNDYHQIKE
jgi:hypothetical protein